MLFLNCKIKPDKIVVLCMFYALYVNYIIHVSDATCITEDVLSSCFQVTCFEDANPLAKMLQ